MRLTEKAIRAGMAGGIGLKYKQAVLLRVGWPLRSGWLERLIGTEVPDENYQEFLTLRGGRPNKAARKIKAMPFGKFQGVEISKVPRWYLEWCILNVADLDEWLLEEIRSILRLPRATEESPPQRKPPCRNRHASVELVGRNYVPSGDLSCPFDTDEELYQQEVAEMDRELMSIIGPCCQ